MYDELLRFAVQLAKAAGGIQLAYFRGDRPGDRDQIQRLRRGDAGRQGERGTVSCRHDPRRAIPATGFWARRAACRGNGGERSALGRSTRSTARPITAEGLPLFSVSIALQHQGRNRRGGGRRTLTSGSCSAATQGRRGMAAIRGDGRGEAPPGRGETDARHVGASPRASPTTRT